MGMDGLPVTTWVFEEGILCILQIDREENLSIVTRKVAHIPLQPMKCIVE